MRFFFIDVVEDFIPNEFLKGRIVLPRTLSYPAGRPDREGPAQSLLLEALAQGGGWLIKASREFRFLGIMSVVKGLRFYRTVPRGEPMQILVRFSKGTDRLLAVTGTLSTPSGDTVASVDAILYVLVPAEGPAYEWGVSGWKVLTRKQSLKIVEDKR